jgi:hypothetical protein
MKRSYWVKVGCCVLLVVLFVVNRLHGEWYLSLGWPWNGLCQMGAGLLDVSTPFVIVYLGYLAMNLK